MLEQPAVVDYLKCKSRQRIKFDIDACRLVLNHPAFIINFKLIAAIDFLKCLPPVIVPSNLLFIIHDIQNFLNSGFMSFFS
jgi:hypothetical protein